MNPVLIALYLLVAVAFFIIGKVTTKKEDISIPLAALAAVLWPASILAVVVHVLYLKFTERGSSQAHH